MLVSRKIAAMGVCDLRFQDIPFRERNVDSADRLDRSSALLGRRREAVPHGFADQVRNRDSPLTRESLQPLVFFVFQQNARFPGPGHTLLLSRVSIWWRARVWQWAVRAGSAGAITQKESGKPARFSRPSKPPGGQRARVGGRFDKAGGRSLRAGEGPARAGGRLARFNERSARVRGRLARVGEGPAGAGGPLTRTGGSLAKVGGRAAKAP